MATMVNSIEMNMLMMIMVMMMMMMMIMVITISIIIQIFSHLFFPINAGSPKAGDAHPRRAARRRAATFGLG